MSSRLRAPLMRNDDSDEETGLFVEVPGIEPGSVQASSVLLRV